MVVEKGPRVGDGLLAELPEDLGAHRPDEHVPGDEAVGQGHCRHACGGELRLLAQSLGGPLGELASLRRGAEGCPPRVSTGHRVLADGQQQPSHSRAGIGRLLRRRVVARHGGAVDERPLVGVGQRPGAGGTRERRPATAQIGRIDRIVLALDGVSEPGVGLDDEQGEQFVAPGHVAEQRGRHHPHVASHRTQGEGGGTDLGELTAGCGPQLGLDAGPVARPYAVRPPRCRAR